jgi:hypothetical protein
VKASVLDLPKVVAPIAGNTQTGRKKCIADP